MDHQQLIRMMQMALYRCFLFSKTGLQPGFKSIHADSDAKARIHALELIRDYPLIETFEVWCNADFAFRLKRHQAHLEHVH
jgi:hypothetical protein